MTSALTPQPKDTKQWPYIAVVLYYKLGPRLYDTIYALLQQSEPPNRVLIVDNNSQDGVAQAVCEENPECELLSLKTNLGYSGGMNAGLNHIRRSQDRILFMTHEVLLESDCVEKMQSAMDTDRRKVLVAPALTRGQGGPVWSYGGKFGKFGGVEHITHSDDQSAVEWLDGACLLVDVHSIVSAGGFDEDFFLYWEDVDISVRLADVGRIACIKTALASQDTSMAPTYFKVRNQIVFWRKRRQFTKVVLTVLVAVAKIFVRDMPNKDANAVRARVIGVLHGLSGNLSNKFLSVRVA